MARAMTMMRAERLESYLLYIGFILSVENSVAKRLAGCTPKSAGIGAIGGIVGKWATI
jgi:hypothetical protein